MKQLISRLLLVVLSLTIMFSARAEENFAEPPSLFFTREEKATIDSVVALQHRLHPEAAGDSIHLSAILYSGPDAWTLWLQGERWTPETNKPHLHVLDVTPTAVRLSLTLPHNGSSKEITLLPHQTFRLSTGKISEGYN